MAGRDLRVLVVGASIAGLATAAALARIDVEVDVIERRAAFEGPGTGLFFPANGVRAVAGLGLAGELVARGRVIERLRARSADGSVESTADLRLVWPDVGPSVAIHRDLAREVLAGGGAAGARTGTALAGLELLEGGVRATLGDGSAAVYDLVVGADGAASTVRRLVWPGADASYGGESWWRGVAICPDALEDWTVSLCEAGNLVTIPIGDGLVYWGAGVTSARPFDDLQTRRAARAGSASPT
jgi:2-polyprenyl-6-methoxyphenol hydroxylase-like FAD-dependent oxidoreductase